MLATESPIARIHSSFNQSFQTTFLNAICHDHYLMMRCNRHENFKSAITFTVPFQIRVDSALSLIKVIISSWLSHNTLHVPHATEVSG